MKTYPHLLAKLYATPLLLRTPERIAFEQVMQAHMAGSVQAQGIGEPGKVRQDVLDYVHDSQATREALRVDAIYKKFSNVAVVKIHGAIDKVLSQFEMDCYGGCDLADVDKALALAEADPKIDTVILDIHSPGGSVTGTPETAARVARMRETKEVHAYTATMCCSGAYYIASQADRIAAAPSSIMGSIGVYMAIIDQTRQLENEGIAVELIKAGRLKAMGASFKKLTDEERDLLQANVDRIHRDFKAAVTTLRKVKDEDMQGQWFHGTEAHSKGLVDEITELSIDEYAASLLLAR
jgi:signal peptide peptidase SppA